MTVDLATQYPDACAGLLNIGLLHTALTGREGHESYAPTTSEKLSGKGYHYWALGHVHNREIVRKNPWIVFPGNTQGRHARELGAKGCMVVEGDADEGIRSVEFVATDVARWQHLTIDATDVTTLEDLQENIQKAVRFAVLDSCERLLALRLSIGGRTSLHGKLSGSSEGFRADVYAWVNEASGGTAWLEKINLSVSAPLDLAALAKRDDPFGMLLKRLNELAADPVALMKLAQSVLSELEQKIPAELRELEFSLKPLSIEVRVDALAAARERLLASISLEDKQ